PGVDGVGSTLDGRRVYFGDLAAPHGSFAEWLVLPIQRLIPIPDGPSDTFVAAAMNPTMSAWVALTQRAGLREGESVLVLGATGNAGRMAVQLARHLGASRVVGAGRARAVLDTLPSLGADEVVPLGDANSDVASALAKAAADVDVVVDYLWGPVTELALAAISGARADPAHRLRWVHVGAMAGPSITLPAATIRKTNIEISGSGQGSVSPAQLHTAYSALLGAMSRSTLKIDTVTMPLADVEQAWSRELPSGTRLVLIP
ncbi:MAG TPA: zinc-binding alcohol dehydrogenase family protein, partial [Pseudonocardia sp.]|nr:zinc-binding alcohol dehydrogenase family protein [Pseudonocardia sp.]